MAINFKDARHKLAEALRIQHTFTELITTEDRFITNTRASASKAKQSQVLEKLAQLDVEKLRDATEETIRVETLRKYGHTNIASIYHSSWQQLERIPGITGESARESVLADGATTAKDKNEDSMAKVIVLEERKPLGTQNQEEVIVTD